MKFLPEFSGFLEIVGKDIQKEFRVRISIDVTVSDLVQINSQFLSICQISVLLDISVKQNIFSLNSFKFVFFLHERM